MAPLMRKVDINEIYASSGVRPLEALVKAVESSGICSTWLVNNEIICMFGVVRYTMLSDKASIWMLGTDLLPDHSTHFLRGCGPEFIRLSQGFVRLDNWCDARNKVTLRWLKWLGFTIEEAKPYGVYDMPFHYFYKEASHV